MMTSTTRGLARNGSPRGQPKAVIRSTLRRRARSQVVAASVEEVVHRGTVSPESPIVGGDPQMREALLEQCALGGRTAGPTGRGRRPFRRAPAAGTGPAVRGRGAPRPPGSGRTPAGRGRYCADGAVSRVRSEGPVPSAAGTTVRARCRCHGGVPYVRDGGRQQQHGDAQADAERGQRRTDPALAAAGDGEPGAHGEVGGPAADASAPRAGTGSTGHRRAHSVRSPSGRIIRHSGGRLSSVTRGSSAADAGDPRHHRPVHRHRAVDHRQQQRPQRQPAARAPGPGRARPGGRSATAPTRPRVARRVPYAIEGGQQPAALAELLDGGDDQARADQQQGEDGADEQAVADAGVLLVMRIVDGRRTRSSSGRYGPRCCGCAPRRPGCRDRSRP